MPAWLERWRMPLVRKRFWISSPLPSKDDILERIEVQKRHVADLTSYIWYIMPVAERFGDKVYDVAAESLAESGLQVSPSRLKELAEELKTPEGKKRYAERRRIHIGTNITGYKVPGSDV